MDQLDARRVLAAQSNLLTEWERGYIHGVLFESEELNRRIVDKCPQQQETEIEHS